MRFPKVVVCGVDGNNGSKTMVELVKRFPQVQVVGLVPDVSLIERAQALWRAMREQRRIHASDPVISADPQEGEGAYIWINWLGVNVHTAQKLNPNLEQEAHSRGLGLREMTLDVNLGIALNNVRIANEIAPDCIYMQQGNPVDTLVYAICKHGYKDPRTVISTGALVEYYRFTSLLTTEFPDITLSKATGLYIGGHGEKAIPLLNRILLGGVLLEEYLAGIDPLRWEERLKTVFGLVVNEATWIRERLGFSPSDGPAQVCADVVATLLNPGNKKTVMSVCSFIEHSTHYGIRDTALSLPVLLGSNGVERVLHIKLTQQVRAELSKAIIDMSKANRIVDIFLEKRSTIKSV